MKKCVIHCNITDEHHIIQIGGYINTSSCPPIVEFIEDATVFPSISEANLFTSLHCHDAVHKKYLTEVIVLDNL